MKTPAWFQQADQALIRAAARARELAAITNTPIHVIIDGKIVEQRPEITEIRPACDSRIAFTQATVP